MSWGLFLGPMLTAAIVAGIVSLIVAKMNKTATLEASRQRVAADIDIAERKIWSDFDVAVQKLNADRDKAMSDKAWVDYELRRDAYVEMAKQIDCLFEGGDPAGRPELHRTARRVRLVGSDQVVTALNELTSAIREGRSGVLEQRYRALFNAMRRDIRQLHSQPPEGTELGEDAFPIES